jgi:hypothetical protein
VGTRYSASDNMEMATIDNPKFKLGNIPRFRSTLLFSGPRLESHARLIAVAFSRVKVSS